MTANQIAYQNMLESKRSNLARESETQRHNLADEGYRQSALAETIRSNLANETIAREGNVIKWSTLGETQRSNLASEALRQEQNVETARSNVAKETETHRSNVVSENINKATLVHRGNELSETERHNKAQELSAYIKNATDVGRVIIGNNGLARALLRN